MEVDPTVRGHREHVRRNQTAVRHDHAEVCLDILDALRNLSGLQRRGLQQFHTGFGGNFRHRRRMHRLSAAAPCRRACDDEGDLVGRRQQGPQRGNGGLGGTSKNNAHGRQFTALRRP